MQTFLPFDNFATSAATLDDKRLNKQILEAAQLLRALDAGPTRDDGRRTAWYGHPAACMWRGFEAQLAAYGAACAAEWQRRGHDEHAETAALYGRADATTPLPAWIGVERVHASHRGNLLRKHREHYDGKIDGDAALPYSWPVMVRGRLAGYWSKHAGAKSGHLDDGRACRSYSAAVKALDAAVKH